MKLEINGASATWNLEIADDEFTNYIVNGVLKNPIKSNDDIDDIYEWNVVRTYNVGKGKIAEPYKKIYKEALDKIKDTSLKELFANKQVKEQYMPTIQDERIMELPINELSPAQLRRIYESPEDSKDFRVQLKKGVEDYEGYFNDIYSERSSNALKTVRIDEEEDFKNRAKFKTLVNAGFTSIKIKAENRQSTSSNLLEDKNEKPKIPKAGKRDKDSGTGDLLTSLYRQEIPLVVKGFTAKRTIREGSSIDPIILEMGLAYDAGTGKDLEGKEVGKAWNFSESALGYSTKKEVEKYKSLTSLDKQLKGEINNRLLLEFKKEMLEVQTQEAEQRDKKLDEMKEGTPQDIKIYENIDEKAKKSQISRKFAEELLAFAKLVKRKTEKAELTLEKIFSLSAGLIEGEDSIKKLKKLPYGAFFNGEKTIFERSIFLDEEKQKIIDRKTDELEKAREEYYKNTQGKKPFRDEEGKSRASEAFENPKEFLKEALKPYLNDLENVYDIEFKVSAKTNKKGNKKYAIDRFLAKPKNIIFKGGGLNPHKKRKETKIIESRKDIASLNAFINSILSRIDTLERGI